MMQVTTQVYGCFQLMTSLLMGVITQMCMRAVKLRGKVHKLVVYVQSTFDGCPNHKPIPCPIESDEQSTS